MRVAFDSQIFLGQRHGGVSRYFARVVDQLARLGEQPCIFAPIYQNVYAHELPGKLVRGRWIPGVPRKTGSVLRAVNTSLNRWSFKNWKPDIIHETWYVRDSSKLRGVPMVTTVYDMIHELLPGEFPSSDKTSEAKRRAVERADHVFCISENTRQDLLKCFSVPEGKVSVSLLACDPVAASSPAAKASFNECDEPYLLYVGHRNGYKNFAGMLRALSISKEARHLRLIAFGGPAFDQDELGLMQNLGFKPGQIMHASGDDEKLAACYAKALAFVYPSLYEGFGLPPLEAMAQGCPVIASQTSSMPEVIGRAGEYFEPTDPEMMAQAIDNVVSSASRRKELVAQGHGRLEFFSWEKCAVQTLEGYRRCVG